MAEKGQEKPSSGSKFVRKILIERPRIRVVRDETHKPGNPIHLLTSGCNTAIENLARFAGTICAPSTVDLHSRIKNRSHLLEIVEMLNEKGIPSNAILVSFDIVNLFRSIDNGSVIQADTTALQTRVIDKPSTEYAHQ